MSQLRKRKSLYLPDSSKSKHKGWPSSKPEQVLSPGALVPLISALNRPENELCLTKFLHSSDYHAALVPPRQAPEVS